MRLAKSTHLIMGMAALVAAIFVSATSVRNGAAGQAQRQPRLSPRRAVISLLDGKEDDTADYRHAYDGIVQTCGPAGAPSASAPSPPEDCGNLAVAVLDIIEDGKMNTQGFVAARTRFALSCAEVRAGMSCIASASV